MKPETKKKHGNNISGNDKSKLSANFFPHSVQMIYFLQNVEVDLYGGVILAPISSYLFQNRVLFEFPINSLNM